MNNLLRTLTEANAQSALPDSDLRLLLTTVKDTRRQNPEKLADQFYESLEALLNDLRTVTVDNHDAEAFLKPVARQEAPDYADIIDTPMDLGTMLKKVKNKSYKSKREFKDDLDLIWSNCFRYNATEGHPLRACASRLKAKAERLLEYITDRKERTEPYIPLALSGPLRPPGTATVKTTSHQTNGVVANGVHRPSSRSNIKPDTRSTSPIRNRGFGSPEAVSFGDSPAIMRTSAGMAEFASLNQALDQVPDDESPPSDIMEALRTLLSDDDFGSPMDEDMPPLESGLGAGDKRKLNSENRPRKRVRLGASRGSTLGKEAVELWWDVVQSDQFLGNGLPVIAHASSSPRFKHPFPTPVDGAVVPAPKPKRPKRRPPAESSTPEKESSLLYLMNSNIRTIKRVRRAHRKLELLTNTDETGTGGLPEITAEIVAAAAVGEDEGVDDRPWRQKGGRLRGRADAQEAEGCLKWMNGKILEHSGFQGSSRMALDVLSGVASEYLLNVGRTIRYLSDEHGKQMTPEEIILHTLFESGITQVQDLERYINDDIIRYGSRMADVEKKLINAYSEVTAAAAGEDVDDDALFEEKEEGEDGAFVMGGFADAFGEDFLGLKELGIADEFGLKSLAVPKRLLRARKNALAASAEAAKSKEPPLPYPPPPPLLPLTVDAADHQIGLLRGYFTQRLRAAAAEALPAQPTPPPPVAVPSVAPPILSAPSLAPPSIPSLKAPTIGLPSAPFTFTPPPPAPSLSSAPATAPSPAPAPSLPPAPASVPIPPTPQNPAEIIVPPDFSLPDELPDAAHCKLGPLGQVLKSSSGGSGGSGGNGGAAGGNKKKSKPTTTAKEVAPQATTPAPPPPLPLPSPTSTSNAAPSPVASTKTPTTKINGTPTGRPVGRPPLPEGQKKKKSAAGKSKKKAENGNSGGGMDGVPPPLVAASA